METNKHGGKANKLDFDPSLIPVNVKVALARLLTEEEPSHGRDNWKKLSVDEHLQHLEAHLWEFQDRESKQEHTVEGMDYHLIRALARAVFAYSVFKSNCECTDCENV